MHATEPVDIQKQLTYEVCMTEEKEERQQSKRMNLWSLQHFVGKKKSRHAFCGYHGNLRL